MNKYKSYIGWGIWVCLWGILYYLGSSSFHLKHMSPFVIVITVLCFLQIISFWLLWNRE